MHKIIRQDFSAHFSYPVVFTRNVFSKDNPALRELLESEVSKHPQPLMLVYVDQALLDASPGLNERISDCLASMLPGLTLPVPPRTLPGGEAIKSDRPLVDRLLREMADARLDRHSYVMAVGGGALLDAVGYAASLVHRGVRMVRVPTTVLAQNDAGVGVKTAINDAAGKNFFGTFAPPWAVINDADFLAALPDAEWRSGIAEAFKVALIKDADFFNWLCAETENLRRRDLGVMEELVMRCAECHLHHIRTSGDPFELGEARPLDFGHWSAHQLEAMTGYAIGHGRAVAIGIMLDSLYAVRAGLLDASAADALYDGLSAAGFEMWCDDMDARDDQGKHILLAGLNRFREHLGGQLCITMPTGIGSAKEISEMDEAFVEQAVTELRERVLRV